MQWPCLLPSFSTNRSHLGSKIQKALYAPPGFIQSVGFKGPGNSHDEYYDRGRPELPDRKRGHERNHNKHVDRDLPLEDVPESRNKPLKPAKQRGNQCEPGIHNKRADSPMRQRPTHESKRRHNDRDYRQHKHISVPGRYSSIILTHHSIAFSQSAPTFSHKAKLKMCRMSRKLCLPCCRQLWLSLPAEMSHNSLLPIHSNRPSSSWIPRLPPATPFSFHLPSLSPLCCFQNVLKK